MFEIQITNNGAAQATNVSLTDFLPPGLTATALNGGVTQGSYDPVTGIFSVGTLASGTSATLTLEGTVDAGQGGMTITNFTTPAVGDQPDPSTAGDDLEETVNVNPLANTGIADIAIAKTAGDATANGENFDVTFTLFVENTGTVTLDNLAVFDDIAAQFGNAYVATSAPTVQNFVGSGTAPTGNAAFATNTSQNLISGGDLDVGDSFEITFVVTIDPDLINDASQGLNNQATASGFGVNPDGTPLTDAQGNLASTSDDSDNGIDPTSENGEDNGDGTFGNDPTPVIIADLAIAKSLAGEPFLNDQGNYIVSFQVAVENTGTVDLASLSLLENLSSQFGSAFINAGNLFIVSGTSDPTSNIAVDSTGWNGGTNSELLDPSNANILAYGDSFIIQFDVEIDPQAVTAPLENQISGSGNAVDASGNLIVGTAGNLILANDLSDSGTNTRGSNPDEPDDRGTAADPTSVELAPVELAPVVSDGDGLASGNPPRFPLLGPLVNNPISGLIGNFIGSPGPIYSGIPINANADPLSLDSGRAVTGGYTGSGDGWADGSGDCDPCGQIIEADPYGQAESCDACGNAIIMEDGCGCQGTIPLDSVPGVPGVPGIPGVPGQPPIIIIEGDGFGATEDGQDDESIVDATETEETDSEITDFAKLPFLKRFTNWLT